MKTYIGIELGSTRIKAVEIDEAFALVRGNDYTWKSDYVDGIWTYSIDEVWLGLKAALSGIKNPESAAAMGVSAMMHGYLAFDEDWNLLVPFRTWQNTVTGNAAEKLTKLFGFNIPQRWSIAHLYQAILNEEPHISNLSHITTLAGYVHHSLTGENVIGIGDASGIFPVDSEALDYDAEMLLKFDSLNVLPKPLRTYLPKVLIAGDAAGTLTPVGARLLDHLLPAGVPFAPPEGDAGTGMTATNAVTPRTGNVSAGTSIFSMVVLERPLKHVYPEIDIVATPNGDPVAMVHCNNCTNDMNAWINLLQEAAELFGQKADLPELYTKLYQKSLEGDTDCGGVIVYNYLTGEGVTHLDAGRPLVVRRPESNFTLANFLRAQLYATMSTLKIGMDILAQENVAIDSITGHGGLFKTPVVGQRYLAAACNAPVTCMETAGEGGPYGMALLAAYFDQKSSGNTLERFLNSRVFANVKSSTFSPCKEDIDGFNQYLKAFRNAFAVEFAAVQSV